MFLRAKAHLVFNWWLYNKAHLPHLLHRDPIAVVALHQKDHEGFQADKERKARQDPKDGRVLQGPGDQWASTGLKAHREPLDDKDQWALLGTMGHKQLGNVALKGPKDFQVNREGLVLVI